MTTSPKLAVGDGALGFWKALAKCYPDTRHQRCWVHKTANILSALPKSVQPKVKAALHEIWMAETRDDAHKAFDRALVRFESKYPGAMERLRKDREELLAFYDFPAETLGSHPDNQSDRIHVRNRPAENQASQKLRFTSHERPRWRWSTSCWNQRRRSGSGSRD